MKKIYTFLLCITGIMLCILYAQHRDFEDLKASYQKLEEASAKVQATNNELSAKVLRLQSSPKNMKGVYQTHLKRLIDNTLSYLGERGNDWRRLLLLTICTESDMGALLRQVKGPAKGITQIEPATERETLSWLKKYRPGIYEKIHKLRVPARLDIHEAEYNAAYAVAMAYSVYVMRKVNPARCSTRRLAEIYKKYYNTYKGKATVVGVLAKLDEFGVKI